MGCVEQQEGLLPVKGMLTACSHVDRQVYRKRDRLQRPPVWLKGNLRQRQANRTQQEMLGSSALAARCGRLCQGCQRGHDEMLRDCRGHTALSM